MEGKRNAARKKIAAAEGMKKFMADYYYKLDRASKEGDKKIAWCTSVGPAELLRAMGFLIYFPETHSAMIGSSKLASEYIPHANILGYSPEICSYMTSDIGAFSQGFTPLTKAYENIKSIPRPDVLVYSTNQCRDVQDWFSYYRNHFNVPLLGINSFRGVNMVSKSHIISIAKQIEDLIEPLERVTGEKFDYDKFKETVKISRECSEQWEKVLYTASAVPSPITFFDCTTLMGPAVVGRGTKEAVEFYKILLSELKKRIDEKVAAVEGESIRIYWDGMPIWGRLRVNSELFAGLKTCVVASTYCNSWIFTSLDSNDPFNSMAEAYTALFIGRSDDAKESYIKKMLEYFRIDGIIYHNSKTCPNNSNSRYGMALRLENETGIPGITIDGDLNDLRFVSDEQTKTKIEAFIEQLEENK
ncbi:MAG: 2-hydroxyacyl-CoA dehydratase family protein [Chitinispirillia bacterium]|jgi:benzoyl-CoA reductase/2-hydroxyglutaryl-CoA dehydratase subunit BcrC/BadD/HgdB